MATIRWCPIAPKWDIYQSLFRQRMVWKWPRRSVSCCCAWRRPGAASTSCGLSWSLWCGSWTTGPRRRRRSGSGSGGRKRTRRNGKRRKPPEAGRKMTKNDEKLGKNPMKILNKNIMGFVWICHVLSMLMFFSMFFFNYFLDGDFARSFWIDFFKSGGIKPNQTSHTAVGISMGYQWDINGNIEGISRDRHRNVTGGFCGCPLVPPSLDKSIEISRRWIGWGWGWVNGVKVFHLAPS